MSMRIVKTLLLIFFCSALCFAQTNKTECVNASEEIRLNPYKPSVYITFEKIAKNTDNALPNQIVLRLHNNTKWQISLSGNNEINGIYNLPYMIKTWKNDQEIGVIGVRKNEVGVIWRVDCGKSILFNVNEKHLTENSYITVMFSYLWEKIGSSGGDYSIFHQAIFDFDDMPKSK